MTFFLNFHWKIVEIQLFPVRLEKRYFENPSTHGENHPSTRILCILKLLKAFIYARVLPEKPRFFIFFINRWCETLTNALENLYDVDRITFSSISVHKSMHTRQFVLQLFNETKPCWFFEKTLLTVICSTNSSLTIDSISLHGR